MHFLFLDDSGAARAPIGEALLHHLAPGHEASSAGWSRSHVRPEVRRVLEEAGIPAVGLRARALNEVALDEIDVVVSFVPDEGRLRVPAGARRVLWALPDPLSAPPSERMEAFRASRDETERRLRALLREIG